MNQGRTAYSTGHRGIWAAVTALVATTALSAQTPADVDEMYVLQGAFRDAKTETRLQAEAAGTSRAIRVFRTPGSIEQVFRLYVKRMHAILDNDPDSGYALVTPPAPASGSSPVFYHLVFHGFEDECTDPGPAAGPECRKWRRGKDKKNALANARIGYEQGEFAKWVEVGTLTWLRRAPNGDVVRLQIEIRDVGLSPDWRLHSPLAQLRFESVVLPPETP